MDKYRIRAVISAAVGSVFIGIIAVTKGRAAILAAGGILIVVMSMAIPAVPVVATMNAALYKQVEAVQSISIVDPTLMFALVSIFCLVTRMLLSRRNRQTMAQNGSLLLWFATFCVGISMGLAGPYSTQYGIDKLLRFMGLTGPLVFLASTWDEGDIEEYFGLLLITSAIVALLEVLPVNIGSAYGDASMPNYLARGRWAGYGAILTLTLWYRMARKRLGRFMSLSVWALCIYVLLATGGRGPIIAYVLSLVVTQMFGSVFDGEALSRRQLKGIAAVAVVSVLLVYLILWAPIDAFALARAKFQLLMSPERGPSTVTRAEHFREALSYFAEYPIRGVGLGGFALKRRQTGARIYPHNLFLEILSETGVAGFLPFCGLVMASLWGYGRAIHSSDRRERVILESALAVLLFAFFNAMVSGDINDNRIVFVMLPILHSLVTKQNSRCLTKAAE
jgi:hypothetical protein